MDQLCNVTISVFHVWFLFINAEQMLLIQCNYSWMEGGPEAFSRWRRAAGSLKLGGLAAISTVAKRRNAMKDDPDAWGQCKWNHTSADNKYITLHPLVAGKHCWNKPMVCFNYTNVN